MENPPHDWGSASRVLRSGQYETREGAFRYHRAGQLAAVSCAGNRWAKGAIECPQGILGGRGPGTLIFA